MATEVSEVQGSNGLTEALWTLLGRKVLVIASLAEPTFCMALQARVMAIDDASAFGFGVTLHFGTSNTLTIPLQGTTARCGSSKREGHQALWVELQLTEGPKVMLEEIC